MLADGGLARHERSGFGSTVTVLVMVALFLCAQAVSAQDDEGPMDEAEQAQVLPALLAPVNVTAEDAPNDRGEAILITWDHAPEQEPGVLNVYELYRSDEPGGVYTSVGLIPYVEPDADLPEGEIPLRPEYRNSGVQTGEEYYYRLAAIDAGGRETMTGVIGPAVASPQWFHHGRVNVMIAVIIFVVAIVYFVTAARSGKNLFIRRLAGLDEMDNAVGRATEMGKPILYISGLSSVSDVATIAAINILGEVAKKTAEYNTKLIVPCADPIVMSVEQEVVKEACAAAGRPDAYNEDDVFYLTRSQFAYVAGVNGIMVRQRPATILYMGMFYAESLVLAETGASVGSIQIAGTDAVTQLPFFITSCDYTLIGEELYAASAYLSREPVLLGGLKGQDTVKFIAGLFLVAAVIVATLAATGVIETNFMAPLFVTG